VAHQLSNKIPLEDGVGSAGVSLVVAREGHIHKKSRMGGPTPARISARMTINTNQWAAMEVVQNWIGYSTIGDLLPAGDYKTFIPYQPHLYTITQYLMTGWMSYVGRVGTVLLPSGYALEPISFYCIVWDD
jgi:hypothetical protein